MLYVVIVANVVLKVVVVLFEVPVALASIVLNVVSNLVSVDIVVLKVVVVLFDVPVALDSIVLNVVL